MKIGIDENGKPILTEQQENDRKAFISSLRGLADWYEAKKELPAPVLKMDAALYPDTADQFRALARVIGSSKKEQYGDFDDYMRLVKDFGRCEFKLVIEKQKTCNRVKVGEKVIPAKPERLLPAEPQKVVDVYEWDCGSILAE